MWKFLLRTQRIEEGSETELQKDSCPGPLGRGGSSFLELWCGQQVGISFGSDFLLFSSYGPWRTTGVACLPALFDGYGGGLLSGLIPRSEPPPFVGPPCPWGSLVCASLYFPWDVIWGPSNCVMPLWILTLRFQPDSNSMVSALRTPRVWKILSLLPSPILLAEKCFQRTFISMTWMFVSSLSFSLHSYCNDSLKSGSFFPFLIVFPMWGWF